jgi:YVTN family beta-propeller protein
MTAKAYVTNTDSDDISVVDLDGRQELTRVYIGGSPRGAVRFDAQRNFGYVSNCAGNTVSVLDLNRNREVARIRVGLAPRGLILSPDGRHGFVSNSGENTLSIIDLVERKEIRRLAMGENPRHMAILPRTNRLLVTQWGSDTIANLDLASGTSTPTSMASTPVGEGARPYSLVATGDGATAYVANTQANYLSVLDVATGREKARVTIGYGGRAAVLSVDDRYAFVSVENSNELVIVDISANAVVKRLEVGPSPRGVALSRSRMEVCSSSFTRAGSSAFGDAARNTLTVIDVKEPLNATVVGHIKVGLGPCSVSVLE